MQGHSLSAVFYEVEDEFDSGWFHRAIVVLVDYRVLILPLLSAMRPGHPSDDVVTADSGSRNEKKTLSSKYSKVAAPYLQGGVMADKSTDIKNIRN